MKLLSIGKKNKNDRIYTKDSFAQSPIGKSFPIYKSCPNNDDENPKPIGYMYIKSITNEGMYGSLDSEASRKIGDLRVVTFGTGTLEPKKDGVYTVVDYVLLGGFLTDDPA